MPSPKSKAVSNIVKLGVRYGPLAYEAIKQGQGPARELANKQFKRVNHRMHAIEHAHQLVDGSVMTVFDGDEKRFIVFTGDKPVASHPSTTKPLALLIEGYDLDKRIRPGDEADRVLPRISRRRKRP